MTLPLDGGGHFFVWFMYASKIVLMIARIISTMEVQKESILKIHVS